MSNATRNGLLVMVCLVMGAAGAVGQQKLAQTGMKFLNVGMNARYTALGQGGTALETNSSAMFYNPASMGRQKETFSFSFGNTQWIADINHYYASLAFSPAEGDYGVFGVTIQSVDYGTIIATIRDPDPNGKGFFDAGDIPGLDIKPSALMLGVGYARAVSEKFSFGGNIKYVTQNLGTAVTDTGTGLVKVGNSLGVPAFDFGILYHTGFKSLSFGMTIRNFSREVRFVNENFQLPLIFKVGMAMNLMDLVDVDRETHSLLVTIDADHPRDFQEQVRVGGEYEFMKTIAVRAGYVSGTDEEGVSLGVGVRHELGSTPMQFDYAYTPFGILGNVHRFSFQFAVK